MTKLIPDDDTLAAAYRRALTIHTLNRRIAEARKEAEQAGASATIPTDLGEQVRQRLDAQPALGWDVVVAGVAAGAENEDEEE